MLRRYGPEAQDIRMLLRQYTAAEREDLFPTNSNQTPDLENNTTIAVLEEMQDKVLALTPTTARQRWLQPKAVDLLGTLMAARWQLGQAESASGIPLPLLLLVMFWFTIIFVSFGLFAPRNMTAIAMLFRAVGIGTAIRMTTELSRQGPSAPAHATDPSPERHKPLTGGPSEQYCRGFIFPLMERSSRCRCASDEGA
jgi:hypothetical protein